MLKCIYKTVKKNIPKLIFLVLSFTSILGEPITFQIDQVEYTYLNPPINQSLLEKFHKLFLQYYPKTFNELSTKKILPAKINLFTDPINFQKKTRLSLFTSGFYSEETFYFLLTPKTIKEEILITLISHESCHAAFNSEKKEKNLIHPVLEEGFCFLNYPSEVILNRDITYYCNTKLRDFLNIAEKNLKSNNRKKKEEVYIISSWFMNFIRKTNSREKLFQIIINEKNQNILDSYWNEFRNNCKR